MLMTGSPGRGKALLACAYASLKHLCVEAIDLFYQHCPDPEVPMEDVAGAPKPVGAVFEMK